MIFRGELRSWGSIHYYFIDILAKAMEMRILLDKLQITGYRLIVFLGFIAICG